MNLPFKDQTLKLPNNQSQAESRLKSLHRMMKLSPKFHNDYVVFMNKIFSDGYAEVVPEDEINKDDGKVWYLPHFGVYHAKKQDKIRVVFDCAAKYGGISLNDMLLQGPDMTNNLTGVLLRFRQSHHGVMGDINGMFFQCSVPKEDRDYLRFLWWPNGNRNQKPDIFRMVVHLFGATSSPSCANLALRRTAYDNITKFDKAVIETILKNFYVDDCLKSLDNEQELIKMVKDLCQLCGKGGFTLSKWISSSRMVLDSIPDDDKAKGVKDLNLDIDTLPVERALGVCWSIEIDAIEFRIKIQPQPTTRRGLLSTVASVYDPLGLASPFVLLAKLILQTMCQKVLGWDDQILEKDLQKWNSWLSDLKKLEQLSVSRCYKKGITKNIISCQLHSFSDASDIAYGVIIYLRLEDSDGKVTCTPVIAKSRVAPIKKITIPRMELTAATVAVRLCNMVRAELELRVNKTFYWTDSMAVLRYIRNEGTRFQTFVANRIEVIRDGTEITNWKYIETKRNPADDASRSLSMTESTKVDRWINGPDFLYQSENAWPIETSTTSDISTDDVEVKKSVASTHVVFKTNRQEPATTLDDVITHFSSWYRLKKALGWYILFIDYLKLKKDKGKINKEDLQMNTCIIQQAETKIIPYVQNSHFSEEIKALKERKTVKKTSSLYKLDPILVGKTLRVGGRLSRSNLPFNSKHQLIIPKKCNVSKLILSDIHKRTGHLGKNTVLSNARACYWILGASSLVKEITSRCVMCRKYRAKVNEQKMADLPFDRIVTGEAPFTRVGMDFFGPIEVKRGRSDVKVYGVIFTCLVVRAVHLEVAASLSTDSCVNAIRRFIARRGPVKVIRSDNGTNLVGAEREMREEIQRWNQLQIKNELLEHEIDWEFNPPSGSHFGGAWERLIRSTRKILYSLLHERLIRLEYESLSTLLCEVEAVLNNRPLTVTSSDKDDLEPLTPNHLLLFKHGEHLPPGLYNKNDNFANRRWRQIQSLRHFLETFRKRIFIINAGSSKVECTI